MAPEINTQTIFVSSTYEDLKDYRKKALDAIVSLKQMFEGMEYFGADSRTPLDVMLDKLSYCQVYIGIIGMRYGSVDKATQKSYTELEYERAKELGIPCLIYIIDDENALIPPKFVDRGENSDKLEVFKNKLRSGHVCRKFTTPDTLAEAIQHDLPETINRVIEEKAKTAIIPIPEKEEIDDKAEYKKTEKFLLRPVKYHGQKVTISMTMLDDINGWRLKSRIVKAFGLSDDDTSSCEVMIAPPSNIKPSVNEASRRVDLFLSGDAAEWLIDHDAREGAIIKATVKLLSARVSNITPDGTPEIIVGLIFEEGISVDPIRF